MQVRTNVVIFERGHLWEPWVPAEANMREIEGRTFYAIRKSDRQFAKAVGLDVRSGSPWGSAPVLAYITGLRNKAMHDAEDDANAADAIEDPKRDKRPRYARCGAVPSVLEIEIPQMECEGNVVEAHVMKVASVANYGFVLEFELTVANVEYLYNAFAASPPSYFNVAPAARKKRRCHKLKPMYSDTPDVVERAKLTWKKDCKQAFAVTSYSDINGRRHQHSQILGVLGEHIAEHKRREVALVVQTFRNERHQDVVADAGKHPIESAD